MISMRNIDRIRQISLEELAQLLVHEEQIDIGDFDWDENPISWYVTRWFSPGGREFMDQEDAIEDCVKWLDSEWNNQEININKKNI